MILEKVYDELNEQLQDLKKQVAALSGGTEVSITPALESGTKIADFEIDDTPGVLYAPTPPAPFSFAISDTPQKIGTYGSDELYIVAATKSSLTSGRNNIAQITGVTDCFCVAASIYQPETGDRIYNYFYGGANLDAYFARQLSDGTATVYVNIGASMVSAGWTQADVILLYTKTPPAPEPEAKKTTKKK